MICLNCRNGNHRECPNHRQAENMEKPTACDCQHRDKKAVKKDEPNATQLPST